MIWRVAFAWRMEAANSSGLSEAGLDLARV